MTTRRASLVQIKSDFSRCVDEAEHGGRSIVITRHGKPAAAIVPLSAVPTAKPTRMTLDEANAFLGSFAGLGDPSFSAVDDLIAGRR